MGFKVILTLFFSILTASLIEKSKIFENLLFSLVFSGSVLARMRSDLPIVVRRSQHNTLSSEAWKYVQLRR